MHPAGSVIGFTVSSGAGYGMLGVIGLLAALGLLPAQWDVGLVAMFIAVSLVTGGLLSSTFHLGHPERAWRAFSQWRSSWLSREGVAAVITYVPAAILGWLWVIEGESVSQAVRLAGAALFVMSIVTVISTAMIYRSLKPIPAWCNGYTAPAYLLIGAASGLMLTTTVFALFGDLRLPLLMITLVAVLASLGLKAAYWRTLGADGFRLPSRESATGLTMAGSVRPLEDPHSSDNYLLKEMGFQVGRKHAERLRKISMGAGFALPALLLVMAMLMPSPTLSVVALGAGVLVMVPGILAERWLFFAEAKHAVTLYYRDRPA